MYLNTSILLIISAIMSIFSFLQQDDYTQYEAIIKFIKYTTWPENKSEITIYAATDDNDFEKMTTFFAQQNIDNKKIKIERITETTNFNDANVVFISEKTNIEPAIIKNKIAKNHVLSLTTNKELLNHGIMFYFKTSKTSTDYLYNRQAVIDSGLTIKSSLLNYTHQYTLN